MQFRTALNITPSPVFRINHHTQIITLGSCFSNVIGEKLNQNKFKVSINPFGVIFNPLSIFKLIQSAAEGKNNFQDTYIQNQGIWYNFDFHSEFSSAKKEKLEEHINKALSEVNQLIRTTDTITITFGTSFVYQLNLTGEIVANCHKIPSFNFEKRMLSSHEIVKAFEKVYLSIKYINPNIKFLLTVSPVRHIKEGIEANSLSKSNLRVACNAITNEFSDTEYFPSFEIMMDDLRDYRFYKEDMIHPSETAENYIWEKFLQRYTTEETRQIIAEWTSLSKAIRHKPFHAESEVHQKFLKETINKVKELSKFINLDDELKILEGRIV